MTSMQESVVLSGDGINQPESGIVSLRVMIEMTEICGWSTIGGNMCECAKFDCDDMHIHAYVIKH